MRSPTDRVKATWMAKHDMMKTCAMLRQPVATENLPDDENNELAASGTGYYAVIGSVRAKGRAEPGVAAQVVGRALDVGSDAARRQCRNDLAHRVGGLGCAAAGGCAGVVASVVSVG